MTKSIDPALALRFISGTYSMGSKREIRRDDGYKLILDETTFSDAANAFLATIESDVISSSVDNLLPPVCREEPCVLDPLGLPGTLEPAGVVAITGGDELSADIVVAGSLNGAPVVIRRVGYTDPGPSVTMSSFDAGINYYGGFGPCEDAYSLIREQVFQHRTIRGSWIVALFGAVFGNYVDVWKERLLGLGTGAGAAVSYLSDMAVKLYSAKIQMGIMASYWNTYQCSDYRIMIWTNTNTMFGGGAVGHCKEEEFSITFDGGMTWHSVRGLVCEFY